MPTKQSQQWTDVIEVDRHGDSIGVWVERGKKLNLSKYEFAFVGDTHERLFTNGRTYRLVTNDPFNGDGPSSHVIEDVHSDRRFTVYYKDMEYYLKNGQIYIQK